VRRSCTLKAHELPLRFIRLVLKPAIGQNTSGMANARVENLLFPAIPSGGVVLDLCCGTGNLAKRLVSRGYE